MDNSVCSVCQVGKKKYKCEACKSPSCSLSCFNQHKTSCQGSSIINNASFSPNVSASVQADPAADDESSSNLEVLFAQYPRLKPKLAEIYSATLKASTRQVNLSNDRYRSKHRSAGAERNWSPEIGFRRGLASLQASLEHGSPESEAMNAFVQLIGGVSSGTEKEADAGHA